MTVCTHGTECTAQHSLSTSQWPYTMWRQRRELYLSIIQNVPEFLHETVNIWHCQFNIFSERLHISLQDLMFCDSEVLNQFILVHLLWGIRLSMVIKTAVDTKISSEFLVTTNRNTCCHDHDDHNMTTSLVTLSLDKHSYLSRGLTLAIRKLSTRSHTINTTIVLT
jgi:hypothetical protein